MRHLFNTKLKIIIILAVLLTAVLAVMAGLTNKSLPELMVQGALAPFRAAATSLTKTAERYYSYMFRYEALEAENEALKAQIANMEDAARKADATERENTRLRSQLSFKDSHDTYDLVDAYIIGWSSTDWSNTVTVSQELINQFAELSGDNYWIHTDPEKCKTMSPFGVPIAQGNLSDQLRHAKSLHSRYGTRRQL